jgi:hypothetical protein
MRWMLPVAVVQLALLSNSTLSKVRKMRLIDEVTHSYLRWRGKPDQFAGSLCRCKRGMHRMLSVHGRLVLLGQSRLVASRCMLGREKVRLT